MICLPAGQAGERVACASASGAGSRPRSGATQRIASLRALLPGLNGRSLVIGMPFTWLLLTFLLPFLMVLRISVAGTEPGQLLGSMASFTDGVLHVTVKLSNYVFLMHDDLYVLTYISSLKYAAATTVCCLLLGYPFAYFMARAQEKWRPTLLMLVMLPFWTSFLLRIYAWKGILANDGLLNQLLLALGAIDAPLHLMNTPLSMMIGMTYAYLPFMVLPLYANLVKMDIRFLEAAGDLGATPWTTFWRVTVPLSKAGIVAGATLVFIPCIGEYVIPELLGGPETFLIGHALWDEFFTNNDWAMASAVTVAVVLMILLPIVWFSKHQETSQENNA
ncbi:ABC transporter permease subunit [Duganella ginsengisoli]|uniref:ABC transporter permease subunit n=2 Tax=Pseudoduganella ginsengisoli TaxID=1462440 RepID=A0A6L6PW07_9BURK|nr:ABC transporter permease subunit [Pseudoduganella ginsengisoli]